jgi:hypothetical protein
MGNDWGHSVMSSSLNRGRASARGGVLGGTVGSGLSSLVNFLRSILLEWLIICFMEGRKTKTMEKWYHFEKEKIASHIIGI